MGKLIRGWNESVFVMIMRQWDIGLMVRRNTCLSFNLFLWFHWQQGIMRCRQCLGDCVIWEESIDERPWEKARST